MSGVLCCEVPVFASPPLLCLRATFTAGFTAGSVSLGMYVPLAGCEKLWLGVKIYGWV